MLPAADVDFQTMGDVDLNHLPPEVYRAIYHPDTNMIPPQRLYFDPDIIGRRALYRHSRLVICTGLCTEIVGKGFCADAFDISCVRGFVEKLYFDPDIVGKGALYRDCTVISSYRLFFDPDITGDFVQRL